MSDAHGEFAQLMRQVQGGSQEAARTLLEQYGSHVYRAVRRRLSQRMRRKFDSEDFVQAVWASIFAQRDALAQFDDPKRLVAFLARVAGNKVIGEYRDRFLTAKRDIRRERSLDDSTTARPRMIAAEGPTPSAVAVAREQWDRLAADLPPHYRRMLELRAAGATNDEIAAELDVSEKTVRRLMQRLQERVVP